MKSAVSFTAVQLGRALLYITLRMGSFTEKSHTGGNRRVKTDTTGHFSESSDDGRDPITQDDNGGIAIWLGFKRNTGKV